MRTRPERILLFRSGRHLQVALDTLRTRVPGCEVTVVATPPGNAALDAAGVDAAHRLIHDATPFFTPWSFLRSATWRAAVRGRYDRVCVLWNDPDGAGQSNVDYTALTVAPLGFTAITPDGLAIPRRSGTNLGRIAARAAVSVAVGGLISIALWLPAGIAVAGRRVLGRRSGE